MRKYFCLLWQTCSADPHFIILRKNGPRERRRFIFCNNRARQMHRASRLGQTARSCFTRKLCQTGIWKERIISLVTSSKTSQLFVYDYSQNRQALIRFRGYCLACKLMLRLRNDFKIQLLKEKWQVRVSLSIVTFLK